MRKKLNAIRKSVEFCTKRDLQVGSQNGFIGAFFGVEAIWDPILIKTNRPEESVF